MSMAVIGVVGGVAAAGVGAAGSAGAFGGGPGPAPGPRSLARSTVQGRDRYGGRAYAQDAEDAMRFNWLNQLLASQGLFGNEAGFQDVTYRQQIPGTGRFQTVTRRIPVQASEGLLGMIRRTQPELDALRAEGDPEGNALMDLLVKDATGMVGQSDPYEERLTQQQLRAAQAARGRGYGTSDVLNEVLGLERNREGRRIQRGTYGAGILQASRGYRGDPLEQAIRLIGAGQTYGGGQAQRSSPWNPQVAQAQQSAYAANLSNWNSGWNNLAAMGGGLASLGQSLGNSRQANAGPNYNRGAQGFPIM